MSARAKTPSHGTPARYRLELKRRREGKTTAGPCDRCRAAESARRKQRRKGSSATTARPNLTVVGDGPGERTSETDTTSPHEPRLTRHRRKAMGTMERAVEDDMADIDLALRVPFHNSLSVLARELAREIDEPATAATARRDARKQLFEVLRSLRTTKEGDDDSAVAVALQAAGFGTPLVP